MLRNWRQLQKQSCNESRILNRMKAAVIETNIIVVANMQSSHVSPECVVACVDALEHVKNSMVVVVDAGMHIFEEYFRHANRSGQPGMGDEFAKWLWDNQGYTEHCELVVIKPTGIDQQDFAEFPADPELSEFDPNDKKFVAVALASKNRPSILNATDSDWMIYRSTLKRNKVNVKCLCPNDIKKHSGLKKGDLSPDYYRQ